MEPKQTPKKPSETEKGPAPATPEHGSATTSSSPFDDPQDERPETAKDDDSVDRPGVLPS
jgi:hypothetical protein